jgi:hypothetical protein
MQTTNADIAELVFDRLAALFGALEEKKARETAEEYARVLKRFPPTVLRHAVDQLAGSRKFSRWPRADEISAVCLEAMESRHTLPTARGADRHRLVNATLRSTAGQAALKAGFGHSVRLFVEDHGRAPNTAQYQQMAEIHARKRCWAETEFASASGADQRQQTLLGEEMAREEALKRKFLT